MFKLNKEYWFAVAIKNFESLNKSYKRGQVLTGSKTKKNVLYTLANYDVGRSQARIIRGKITGVSS